MNIDGADMKSYNNDSEIVDPCFLIYFSKEKRSLFLIQHHTNGTKTRFS